jgi:hypothetical protein
MIDALISLNAALALRVVVMERFVPLLRVLVLLTVDVTLPYAQFRLPLLTLDLQIQDRAVDLVEGFHRSSVGLVLET